HTPHTQSPASWPNIPAFFRPRIPHSSKKKLLATHPPPPQSIFPQPSRFGPTRIDYRRPNFWKRETEV
ncbi:uncharacterized protein GLRG_04336, partial [Colletotrichum graminicola M1.001]